MLLDRIEIDSHGPLNRVELGPLSHHLNVVVAAPGSGKTAIGRFIRDSLIDRDYPRGMLSGSAGRVVWVHQNGWIHCRREQDGSPGGRRSVEFESRGETAGSWNGYTDGWFDVASPSGDHNGRAAVSAAARHLRSSLASRTLGDIRIPESIVDGVMVDTTISSTSRVVAACIAAGLDQPHLAPLPFQNETARYSESGLDHDGAMASRAAQDDRRRRALREELADVEVELSKLTRKHDFLRQTSYRPDPRWENGGNAIEIDAVGRQRAEFLRHHDDLLARRGALLAQHDRQQRDRRRYGGASSHDASEFGSAESNAGSVHAQWIARDARLRSHRQRADSLRTRAAALQRWIAKLDAQHGGSDSDGYADVSMDSSRSSFALPPSWHGESAEQLQNRIRHADQEVLSLRRVLADVRSLRELLNLDDLAVRIESTTDHLDWLLSRFERPVLGRNDGSLDPRSWMLEVDRDGMMEQSLRRVRDQLRRRDFVRPAQADAIMADLHRTLDRLLARRRRAVAALAGQPMTSPYDFQGLPTSPPDWRAQRDAATGELASVEEELQVVLDQIAVLRHSQRFLPILDPVYPIGMGYSSAMAVDLDPVRAHDAWQGELRSIDAEIARCHGRINDLDHQLRDLQARRPIPPVSRAHASNEHITRLQRRRDELITQLNGGRPIARSESSLAELANRWLTRLSDGRHCLLDWTTSPVAMDRYTTLAAEVESCAAPDHAPGRSVHVSIDHVDERNVSATTRAIAAMAVRMAAGELLERMGHSIPLVLETHRELFADDSPLTRRHGTGESRHLYRADGGAYEHWTSEGVSGDAIAAALADYSAAGRQLLILTEHTALANYLQRCGARYFSLHTQRIVHPHRPTWRGGQRDDRYTGPHVVNGNGLSGAADRRENEIDWTDSEPVNQAFDQAWRQNAGLRGDTYHGESATDVPAAGATYRDGYYYANQSSTVPAAAARAPAHTTPSHATPGVDVAQSLTARHHRSAMTDGEDVPFFLTVDSPIDAAPSIDAVAAQRLRRIGISHITHLMNQDSNRLADTLGLAGVDARAVRRWQAECRLMCRVPQLRGFDARVLVGCGITDPAQLAAIDPTDLLDRVKTFLATERGQRILLSGTSYELSRITSWIASANESVHTGFRSPTVDGRRVPTRVVREELPSRRRRADAATPMRDVESEEVCFTDDDFDRERYEVQVERRADRIVDDLDELARDYEPGRTSSSLRRTGKNRDGRSGESTATVPSSASDRMTGEATTRSRRAERNLGRKTERKPPAPTQRVASESVDRGPRVHSPSRDRADSSAKTTLRFYLQRADDVVDAPSIGPRMAERLNKIGIVTVDDLLQGDAAEIAENLRHRRVETSTVNQWQQQTTFVCRVPMMRGHDAQFLVAAGVTTAEELAACDPQELFELVDEIAQSSEGKRIARGGALPDLDEVTQWVENAAEHRSLRAA